MTIGELCLKYQEIANKYSINEDCSISGDSILLAIQFTIELLESIERNILSYTTTKQEIVSILSLRINELKQALGEEKMVSEQGW